MRINKHDTNGTKPLLGKGELGYDDYSTGGDTGRVYVGTGSVNIPQAKKAEVVAVDGKIDTHVVRVDNPHAVTKAQVGLGNVQDVDTTNASNITSGTLANARLANSGVTAGTYKSVTVDGKGIVTGGTNPTTLGGYGITDTYTKTETNTQISTAVNGLVDAAPGTLDTLNELAAALGDDPNFATTIANSIGTKVDKVTSTDNAIVRFDGTTGAVQNSAITIDDNGNIGSGTQTFNGFGGTGLKNYIINGGFNVNQYPAYSATDGYKIDRWVISGASSVNNVSQGQLNGEAESDKGLVISKNSTSATAFILQRIEFPRRLAGKKVTISFKCYSPNTFNGTVYFDKYNPTDGLSNAVNVQTFSWSNSWNKYSLTFTLPTLGTNYNHKDSSFQLVFTIPQAVTTTGAWLTDVQLELGSVATPFENRPYGLELSLCQRYFRSLGLNTSWRPIGTGGVTNGTYVDTTCELPIPMRRNPDLSVVGAYSNYSLVDGVGTYTPTSIAIQDSATDCINIRSLYSGGTAGRPAKLMTTTTNGGILLNAEL